MAKGETSIDKELKAACERLWKSVTEKRMYVTGGIGSTCLGEAFTKDYDLPNDTAYAETCASIGLMFFASRMLENEVKGVYADVMERAFYNTVLAGMQLDGKRFFYVNPLEVVPGIAGEAVTHKHVNGAMRKNSARRMQSLRVWLPRAIFRKVTPRSLIFRMKPLMPW